MIGSNPTDRKTLPWLPDLRPDIAYHAADENINAAESWFGNFTNAKSLQAREMNVHLCREHPYQ